MTEAERTREERPEAHRFRDGSTERDPLIEPRIPRRDPEPSSLAAKLEDLTPIIPSLVLDEIGFDLYANYTRAEAVFAISDMRTGRMLSAVKLTEDGVELFHQWFAIVLHRMQAVSRVTEAAAKWNART